MKDTVKLMQLYLDGQLAGADRAALESRLEQSETLRAELREYERMRRSLQAVAASPEFSNAEFLWQRVKNAIHQEVRQQEAPPRERSPWWDWDFRWAFGSMAALVLIVLGLTHFFWLRLDRTISAPNDSAEGYSFVTVYSFEPGVYPAEYKSKNAGANVIWLTGADAYDLPRERS
ncbi:MAG: hypothetical protein JO317_08530 [Verrucomicrobiae bacterium]|nr:hypothetical protein [Verrucomicrobiae bacterium]